MLKDLTAYLKPDLELVTVKGTYSVPPPSKEVGLQLAAINALGVGAYLATLQECPHCGRAGGPEISEETRRRAESIADRDLGELSLSEDVYARMVADGVPGPHIDTYAVYALYYWTLGEETADKIMEAQAPRTGAQDPKAKARSRSKSGPRSA